MGVRFGTSRVRGARILVVALLTPPLACATPSTQRAALGSTAGDARAGSSGGAGGGTNQPPGDGSKTNVGRDAPAGTGGARAAEASTRDGAAGDCSRTVDARRYETDGLCLGPLETVGCVDTSRSCAERVVPALSPDGKCWRFSQTCLPPGFTAASNGDCPVDAHAPECASRALSGADKPCVKPIFATNYDAEGHCMGPGHAVGCTRTDGSPGQIRTCAEVLTWARASDGTCWMFGSDCIADGFTVVADCAGDFAANVCGRTP